MNRDLQRRLSQIEMLLPEALERRRGLRERLSQRLCDLARVHATAVAGIVAFGDPKIEEPLAQAWARTMSQFEEIDRVALFETLVRLQKHILSRDAESSSDSEADCLNKSENNEVNCLSNNKSDDQDDNRLSELFNKARNQVVGRL